MKRIILLWILVAAGCSQPATAPVDHEAETLARTEFTERVENFFEYEPLRPGKPSAFLIHLTDLSDGSPVEKAHVTLVARSTGTNEPVAQTVSRVGRVTGIYVAELTIPKSGDYDIEFHIKNEKLDERLSSINFKVE
jgi:5-hydroxyisourate hydrolase-like protein (transthyretin family)